MKDLPEEDMKMLKKIIYEDMKKYRESAIADDVVDRFMISQGIKDDEKLKSFVAQLHSFTYDPDPRKFVFYMICRFLDILNDVTEPEKTNA